MTEPALAIEVLLDGPHPALWDSPTMRETLRFLRKRGQDIPPKDLSRLIRAILKGPPRELYRYDLSDDEWKELRDHAIRLRLLKLRESGLRLPKYAQKVYDRIESELPWTKPDSRSEEFPFFMSSGWVDRKEVGGMRNFAAMVVDDFIQWADAQKDKLWDCDGGWFLFCEKEPKTALDLLIGAGERDKWHIAPWHDALSHLEKSKRLPNRLKRAIAETLADMPVNDLAQLALQAARWLEQARPALGKRLRQKLWAQIWEASLATSTPEGDLDFDLTLNHAGGLLGGILYDEMTEYVPQVSAGENPGLPRQLRSYFEKIADSESPSAKLARVRMASMLFWLLRIDQEWTERVLLRRMDPDNADAFDPFLWEGYLWNPRISDDLLEAFKGLFFKVLANLKLVPERIRFHGPQLFIVAAVPPDRGISVEEAQGVLHKLRPGHLADAAWTLKNMLKGAGDKAPALWRGTIGPWFKNAWPKRTRDRSKKLSENLAWMAIDAGDAFPDAVTVTEHLVEPEEWHTTRYHLQKVEEETGLVSRFPEAALTLVSRLTGNKTHLVDDTLKSLLEIIAKAKPELKETKCYKHLAALAQ